MSGAAAGRGMFMKAVVEQGVMKLVMSRKQGMS